MNGNDNMFISNKDGKPCYISLRQAQKIEFIYVNALYKIMNTFIDNMNNIQ